MSGTAQKTPWTAPKFDFRGIMLEDADDRRYQQRALEKARFVPYLCRPNRDRPQRLRTYASHRRTGTGRQSGSRPASRRAAHNGATAAAASGGGGDDGGDGDGGGDPPPPTPELLALVDDLADLAADLYLRRIGKNPEKP